MKVFTHFWRVKALPTAQLCVWRALQDRLTTFVCVEKRGTQSAYNMCVMCDLEEENHNLFLTCSITSRI